MFSSVISVFLLFGMVALDLNTSLGLKASKLLDNKYATNIETSPKILEEFKNSSLLDNGKIRLADNSSSKFSGGANESKLFSTEFTSKSQKNSKKSELIYDYDDYDDYDDDEGDEESGYESETGTARNNTRRRRIFVIKRIGTTYAWGRWEKWSRCSNSCVQIRKRQCIKRIQNSTESEAVEITFYPNLVEQTTGCFGIMKKYRLCKDEKCKFSNRQMRDEQCSTYNRQAFKGKFYNWQGYEKEHNECELYCKPIDSDIFISMNQSVTDGTPCEKPAIYYTHYYKRKAVCVEGICKVFR